LVEHRDQRNCSGRDRNVCQINAGEERVLLLRQDDFDGLVVAGIETLHRRVVDAHAARGGGARTVGWARPAAAEGKPVASRVALCKAAHVRIGLTGKNLERAGQCRDISGGLVHPLDRVPQPGFDAERGKPDQHRKRKRQEYRGEPARVVPQSSALQARVGHSSAAWQCVQTAARIRLSGKNFCCVGGELAAPNVRLISFLPTRALASVTVIR
jgi:hypothetical protein